MPADPDFVTHLIDLFAGNGPIRKGRLFGGTSLYIDDAMFGVIFGDALFMKSDNSIKEQYQAAGSTPFSYGTKNGERVIPGLMSLPDSALDDPDEAQGWLNLSLIPARKAALKRKK